MTALRRACIMGHPVTQSRSPILHGYWLKKLNIEGAYEREEEPSCSADFAPALGDSNRNRQATALAI